MTYSVMRGHQLRWKKPAYRSVFEKGFGVLRFEPEAAELAEDVALPLSVEVLVEGEGTADFADAAARLIAAIPLALTAEM